MSGGSSTTYCEGRLPPGDSLLRLCQKSAGWIRVGLFRGLLFFPSVCDCHPPVPSCVECCNCCTWPFLLRIVSAVQGLVSVSRKAR